MLCLTGRHGVWRKKRSGMPAFLKRLVDCRTLYRNSRHKYANNQCFTCIMAATRIVSNSFACLLCAHNGSVADSFATLKNFVLYQPGNTCVNFFKTIFKFISLLGGSVKFLVIFFISSSKESDCFKIFEINSLIFSFIRSRISM